MKQEIRMKMLSIRGELTKEEVLLKSKIIIKKIKKDERFKNANVIGIFNAFGNEIDLQPLFLTKKVFAYPKVMGEYMNFYIIDSNTKYVKSKYGIMEPEGGLIANSLIDLLIVPLLAFNDQYHRIGYGRGYYDKFIKKYQPKHKIGVGYQFQFHPFEAASYDVMLDDMITDEEA